ncbi:MAG: hypothetical protein VKO21_09495 [Candidatus Sericytochromatia bacterium]|nr:hypothetical protein [Candidatus Sericytochromatia bacterium]
MKWPRPLLAAPANGLVAHAAGALVGHDAAGRRTRTVASTTGTDEIPVAGLVLELRNGRGDLLRDNQGRPFLARTDAEGRYAFPATAPSIAKVVVGQLGQDRAGIQFIAPAGVTRQDLNLAGFLASTYILTRYTRTQQDPEAALGRLRPEVHESALKLTADALTYSGIPRDLDLAAAEVLVDRLRQTDVGVDGVYERIRRDLVVAGQADLGSGVPALEARFEGLKAVRRDPGGRLYLLDGDRGRLWQLEQGRIKALAGNGAGRGALDSAEAPSTGADAKTTRLGALLDLNFDQEGRALILSPAYLARLEPDGTLTRLWGGEPFYSPNPGGYETAYFTGPYRVHVLRDGGIVLQSRERLFQLGSGTLPPLPPIRKQAPDEVLPSEQSQWIDLAQDDPLSLRLLARVFVRPAPADNNPYYRLWQLGGTTPERLDLAHRHLLGFTEDGGLVASDGEGSLVITGPDGDIWLALDRAQTSTWPEFLRPHSLGWSLSASTLRVSGNRKQGFVVYGAGRVALLARDGTLTPVAGPWQEPVASDLPAPLGAPTAVTEGPDGALYAFDDTQGRILRLDRNNATVHAGTAWPGADRWFAFAAEPGNPTGFTMSHREGSVEGFGGDYAAAAGDAWIVRSGPLRFTPDGALWFADTSRVLRRVIGGRLTTPWVSDRFDIEDYRPDPARAGRMLVLRHTAYPSTASAQLFRLEAGQNPELLVSIPKSGCCFGKGGSSFVPLSDGGFLIRARGEFWRWKEGEALQEIGKSDPVEGGTSGAYMGISREGKVALARQTSSSGESAAVYRVNPASGRLTLVAGKGAPVLDGDTPDTSLVEVGGIDVAEDGSLLIADKGAGQIKRIPASAW